MAHYSVPQFIEEESRIVFFLTFRQFFILLGGGIVCFALFITLPPALFVISSMVIVLLAIAIAFLKINNQPVIKALLSYFGFITGPKNYIWKKEDPNSNLKSQNAK